MNNDELKHYGVLGMKWGMRKAYKSGTSYNYKSHGQKKYDKKVAKLEATQKRKLDKMKSEGKKDAKVSYKDDRKLQNAKQKQAMYRERDANRVDYARSTSVGKSFVKALMFGPFGSGNYNRFRASGHGRVVSALGSNWVSSTLGYPVSLLVSRSSENRFAKTQTNSKRGRLNE